VLRIEWSIVRFEMLYSSRYAHRLYLKTTTEIGLSEFITVDLLQS